MVNAFQQEVELSRRRRGNLSETLIAGLNRHPPDFLEGYISDHMKSQYPEYIGNRSVTVLESNLNPYTWMDSEEVDIRQNISWRPDFIAAARLILHRRDEEWELASTKLNNSSVDNHPIVDSDEYGLMVRAHYPIEVKSGDKLTLTEQQAEALPHITENSSNVHPLLAEVDISDLPESFEVLIQSFDNSSFSGGRYKTQ